LLPIFGFVAKIALVRARQQFSRAAPGDSAIKSEGLSHLQFPALADTESRNKHHLSGIEKVNNLAAGD
jgi:hypothetical protein